MSARQPMPTAARKTLAGLTISRLTPGDLANLKEPDVTCELLSDEDMEKIFQFKEEKQNETV